MNKLSKLKEAANYSNLNDGWIDSINQASQYDFNYLRLASPKFILELIAVAEAAKDFIFGEVDLEDDKRQYNKLVETLKKLEK